MLFSRKKPELVASTLGYFFIWLKFAAVCILMTCVVSPNGPSHNIWDLIFLLFSWLLFAPGIIRNLRIDRWLVFALTEDWKDGKTECEFTRADGEKIHIKLPQGIDAFRYRRISGTLSTIVFFLCNLIILTRIIWLHRAWISSFPWVVTFASIALSLILMEFKTYTFFPIIKSFRGILLYGLRLIALVVFKRQSMIHIRRSLQQDIHRTSSGFVSRFDYIAHFIVSLGSATFTLVIIKLLQKLQITPPSSAIILIWGLDCLSRLQLLIGDRAIAVSGGDSDMAMARSKSVIERISIKRAAQVDGWLAKWDGITVEKPIPLDIAVYRIHCVLGDTMGRLIGYCVCIYTLFGPLSKWFAAFSLSH